ncbi:CG42261 [Drosophila busckii]|uniref:CG42261 n=1 Tax=Drosophila busckii TaxID=30019 RepID=A0A0M4EPH3_DROBS|nr:CG42261 [Drosophila busckii]
MRVISAATAQQKVALCDNLELPFRDDSFDAVLSLAVVHHFATTERRVRALRELARILRIGGRVVITVWALEQRHRRFESQDVLIPWQPPKNRTYSYSYSDEEDDDDFLPPYHAYTEDSTNSSRSAGDGDSSSLSSSSPGESCYSFKLAGGRRHAWFLDSWTSKDTKNDSSLDYEDAKDLPIELRRLEDFEDFHDPPLTASLKSRSLGSILQPPPRQIVRSRSSVPSLGGPLLPATQGTVTSPPQSMAAVSAAMAILTPAAKPARFSFDDAHIKQQREQQTIAAHKITRQTIREMPPIPKFRKQQSLQLARQNFPIVRRASGSGVASSSALNAKLLSLELFNPATDDLDSDSSEPSSPDSIDSVISAPRSAQLLSAPSTSTAKSSDESESALAQTISINKEQYHKGELQINNATPNTNDIILNADSAPLLPEKRESGQAQQPQDCAEFAEQLTAQLQRELDDKSNRADCRSLDGIGDIGEYLNAGAKKRSNGDLTSLRDELRERRLMLANLSTQPSLQHSPMSSSTSSLSSQTRSFTIHEEQEGEDEENERSYSLGIYEHCKISKFNYKRNCHYNLNPETAYLLQDDGDSDVRDDEDPIPEEDEDAEALEALSGDQLGEGMVCLRGRAPPTANSSGNDYGQRRRNLGAIKSVTSSASSSTETAPGTPQQSQQQQSLQQVNSTDSVEHSNSSTASLDSPSQGGATTHHRYYHVFREGELDALINHHVASLHIVSSYYERASWCVVAEKVQVWTI